MNEPQRAQAQRFGVEVIDMNTWSPQFTLATKGPVYLSLDLDVLDPPGWNSAIDCRIFHTRCRGHS